MIQLAIISLIVILVIANLVLVLYNYLYPPCETTYDYFKSARTLPDNLSSSLGSIPSGTDLNYIGAATVPTDDPNVIGLTSRLNTISDNNKNKILNAVFESENDVNNHVDSRTKTIDNSYKDQNIAIFEREMEGLKTGINNIERDKVFAKPSGFVNQIQLDGYSDRKPHDF